MVINIGSQFDIVQVYQARRFAVFTSKFIPTDIIQFQRYTNALITLRPEIDREVCHPCMAATRNFISVESMRYR